MSRRSIEPRGQRMTDLESLAARIPLVGDGVIMRLGNDMRGAARDLEIRAGRGPLSRLWNKVTGHERRERDHLDRKLVKNQQRIASVVRELAEHQRVTNLALTELTYELGAVRDVAWRAQETADLARAEVRELAELTYKAIGIITERLDQHQWTLEQHARQLARHGEHLERHDRELERHTAWLEVHDERLDQHLEILQSHDARLIDMERRQLITELWQQAQHDFENALRRWEHHGAYADLPWIAQIVLLAREVASGGAGLHAFATGDSSYENSYQERLDERIRARPDPGLWTGLRSLERILDDAAAQSLDDDHRLLVAELLGAGVAEEDRVPDTPLAAALARTMVLYSVPPAARPISAAAEALARVPYVMASMTTRDVIRYAVREQADAVWRRRETLLERRRRA